MQNIQAVNIEEYGVPAEVTRITHNSLPEPQDNQIRVKMKLSPIHNHDVLMISGDYGVKLDLPIIGGTEAFGIVDAVGSSVQDLKKGDRITIVAMQGTWSEYFLADREHVISIPDNVPDELAAQLFAMPASAMMALNKLNLQTGDWLAINAANGAVGKTLVQIASSRGINTINLVRSQSSKKTLMNLGAVNVFSTNDKNWKQEVANAIGNNSVMGAIDMVGGAASKDLFHLVGNGATLLSFGAMSDNILQIDVADLIYKETTLKGFWGNTEFARASKNEIAAIFGELIKLAQDDKLTLPVAAKFSLNQNKEALRAYFNDRNGKIMFSA